MSIPTGWTVGKIAVEDGSGGAAYNVKAELGSSVYGQIMGGHLMVISSSLVAPFGPTFPVSESRAEPIVLQAGMHRKHIRLKLPEKFKIDEMPIAVNEQMPWGSFSVSYQQKPGELSVEEMVRTDAVTLPAEQYKQVKKFFDQVYGADAQQAVLAKD